MILDGTKLAREWTERRVAVPLAGKSATLTLDPSFPPAVRMNAIFVSRTTSANALGGLREKVLGVLAGKTTPAAAAKELRSALEGDAGAGGLLSPGRAEQIVRQQAMQAYAVGERAVALDPAVMEAFPFFRYEATKDDRTRDTHRDLDGLVLRKDDPFWRTHTPPWEYGCRCALSPVDAEEAAELGVGQAVTKDQADGGQNATVERSDGRVVNLPGAASGYVFDVEGAFRSSDMGQVKDLKSRREVLGEMIDAARGSNLNWRFIASPDRPEGYEPPANVETIRQQMEELSAKVRTAAAAKSAGGGKGPLTGVSGPDIELGPLLSAHADGLGIRPDESSVRLPVPGTADSGVHHWSVRHAQDLADPKRAMDLLARSLWNPGARAWIDVTGKDTVRMMIGSREGRAVSTLVKAGNGWELEAASAIDADPRYMDAWKEKRRG